MYHYVRSYNSELPNFKFLDYQDFCKQLDYFEENYGFVSKKNFLDSLKSGKPSKGVILTFDDGARCNYDYVFPELKKRGLWGVFYIPTLPYSDKIMPSVHKIHYLLGKYDSGIILKKLNQIISSDDIDSTKVSEFDEIIYKRQVNNISTTQVKKLTNYFIKYNNRSKIINELFNFFEKNEQDIIDNYYMSIANVKEMSTNGMIIGSHTVSHPVMSNLNFKRQSLEIINSFSFLNKNIGSEIFKTYCHPYGGFHNFNEITLDILKKEKCLFSFNVDQRDITSLDLIKNCQALPRYDCNQFPYGQIRIYE